MFVRFYENTINAEHLLFYYVGQCFEAHALFAVMRGRESDLPLRIGSHRACMAAQQQLDQMLFADEVAVTAVSAPHPLNGISANVQLSVTLRPLWSFIDPKYKWLSWCVHSEWQVHEVKPRYETGWVSDANSKRLGGIQVPNARGWGSELLQRPCPHDPVNVPGGMYHCPECGEVVVAGFPHPTPEMLAVTAVSAQEPS